MRMQTVHRLSFIVASAVAALGFLLALADTVDLFGLGPTDLAWRALSALLVVLAAAVAWAIHARLTGVLWAALVAYTGVAFLLVGGVGAAHAAFGVPLLLAAAFLELGAQEVSSATASEADRPPKG